MKLHSTAAFVDLKSCVGPVCRKIDAQGDARKEPASGVEGSIKHIAARIPEWAFAWSQKVMEATTVSLYEPTGSFCPAPTEP